MPEFTIYVTGGGDYFYTTLNAIAMIFNDGSLIWSVVMLGGMFAIISGAWYIIQKNIGSGLMKTHTFLEHGIIMVLVTFLAFVPTRVTVQDIYGQQNATPIDNVPLLISVPAAMFSGIGYDVFRTIDTAFQSTSGSTMSVSENGFVTPLKLMMAVRGGIEQVSPGLYRSWVNYIGACTYNSAVTAGGISHATNVSDYLLSNGKDGGLVDIYLIESGGIINETQTWNPVTCAEAKVLIEAGMEAMFASGGATNPMPSAMRVVNMRMTESNKINPNGDWDFSDIDSAHASFYAAVGSSAQSAQEFMQNSLIRNAVLVGYECGGNYLSAADQLACAQTVNDTLQQYSIDAAGKASWFSKMMLPAMTILQLLFFAFSVVAFLYGIIRGAGAVVFIGKYFLFGAWVFSWLPFVAIINAFINWMVVDKMSSVPVSALTIENYDSYFTTIQSNLALASDLLAATPLITLGFLTGSMYAFSGFAQRLSNNDFVNEKNLAPSTVDVSPVVRYGPSASGDSKIGMQSSASTFESVNVSNEVGRAKESAYSRSVTDQIQMADQFSAMVKAQSGSSGSVRITDSDGVQVTASNTEMFNHGLSRINALQEAGGITKQEALSAQAAVKLGVSAFGSGVGFGAAWDAAMSSTSDKNVQKALQEAMGASAQYAQSAGVALSNAIQTDSVTSNSKAKEIASGFSETVSRAEQSAKQYRDIESASAGLGTNLTATVPQLASKLIDNQTAQSMLGDGVAKMQAQEGSSFNSWVNAKMSDWRSSGASFANMQQMAELQGLRHFGDNGTYGRVLSSLMTTSDLSGSDASRYSSVAGAVAGGVQIQGNIGAHDGRVEGYMPGAGEGKATLQGVGQLQNRAELSAQDAGLGDVKGSVLTNLGNDVKALPPGGFNGGSAGEVLNQANAQAAARAFAANPPETVPEYNALAAETKRQHVLGNTDYPYPPISEGLARLIEEDKGKDGSEGKMNTATMDTISNMFTRPEK